MILLFSQNNVICPFRLAVCFDEEYWGDNCLNKCTCAINATLGIRTSSCDQSTGNCYCRGYRYWGPKCDKEEEPCPPGYYNSHGKKREDRPDNYGDCKICRVSGSSPSSNLNIG